MKEQKLIEMGHKIEALGNVLQQVITELEFVKTIAMGDHRVVKQLEEFPEIIEKLREETNSHNPPSTSPEKGETEKVAKLGED